MAIRMHVLRRRLRSAWRRRSLRVATGLLVLSFLIALDLYLVAPLFDPRIDGLEGETSRILPGDRLLLDGFLGPKDELSLDPQLKINAELRLEKADLADEQRAALEDLGAVLPSDEQEISYTISSQVADSGSCRTTLQIKPEASSSSSLGLRLELASDSTSNLEVFPLRLASLGGALRIEAKEVDEARALQETIMCGRLLRVGDFKLRGALQLLATVGEDSPVDLAFYSQQDHEVLEPFSFRKALLAQSLEITSVVSGQSSMALRVESNGSSPSIRVTKLTVGRDYLMVGYTGKGTARGPRAPEGTYPFERFKQGLIINSLIGTFLAAVNLTLFNWLRKTIFGRDPAN